MEVSSDSDSALIGDGRSLQLSNMRELSNFNLRSSRMRTEDEGMAYREMTSRWLSIQYFQLMGILAWEHSSENMKLSSVPGLIRT